jgi:hypothetical protein
MHAILYFFFYFLLRKSLSFNLIYPSLAPIQSGSAQHVFFIHSFYLSSFRHSCPSIILYYIVNPSFLRSNSFSLFFHIHVHHNSSSSNCHSHAFPLSSSQYTPAQTIPYQNVKVSISEPNISHV